MLRQQANATSRRHEQDRLASDVFDIDLVIPEFRKLWGSESTLLRASNMSCENRRVFVGAVRALAGHASGQPRESPQLVTY
jgi:hypothetical protein